jgi:hypothetical protein
MNSILTYKYQNARNLMEKMTSDSSDERLDCESILRERDEWVLKKNELKLNAEFDLNFKEELKNFFKKSQNNESFLYSVIKFQNNLLNSDSEFDSSDSDSDSNYSGWTDTMIGGSSEDLSEG